MGSNERPNTPIRTLASPPGAPSGPGRGAVPGTEPPGPVGRGMVLHDVGAGLLHVLLVPEDLVCPHQPLERIGDHAGTGVAGHHAAEQQNGGVPRLEAEIEQRVAIVLLRELLGERREAHRRPRRGGGAAVAAHHLLVHPPRRLPVGRVELRTPPQIGVGVAGPEQRVGGERALRLLVRHPAEFPHRLEVAPLRELNLPLEEMEAEIAGIARLDGGGDLVEPLERPAPVAPVERLLRRGPEGVHARLRPVGDRHRQGGGPVAPAPGEQGAAEQRDPGTPIHHRLPSGAEGGGAPSALSLPAASFISESGTPVAERTRWYAMAAPRTSPCPSRASPRPMAARQPAGEASAARIAASNQRSASAAWSAARASRPSRSAQAAMPTPALLRSPGSLVRRSTVWKVRAAASHAVVTRWAPPYATSSESTERPSPAEASAAGSAPSTSVGGSPAVSARAKCPSGRPGATERKP